MSNYKQTGKEVEVASVNVTPFETGSDTSTYSTIYFEGCNTEAESLAVAQAIRAVHCAICSQKTHCMRVSAVRPPGFWKPDGFKGDSESTPVVAFSSQDINLTYCGVYSAYIGAHAKFEVVS